MREDPSAEQGARAVVAANVRHGQAQGGGEPRSPGRWPGPLYGQRSGSHIGAGAGCGARAGPAMRESPAASLRRCRMWSPVETRREGSGVFDGGRSPLACSAQTSQHSEARLNRVVWRPFGALGPVTDDPEEMLPMAIRIAARYVAKSEEYGRRNADTRARNFEPQTRRSHARRPAAGIHYFSAGRTLESSGR